MLPWDYAGLPETGRCPIWRLWIKDYKEAISRARRESERNADVFAKAREARQARSATRRPSIRRA